MKCSLTAVDLNFSEDIRAPTSARHKKISRFIEVEHFEEMIFSMINVPLHTLRLIFFMMLHVCPNEY